MNGDTLRARLDAGETVILAGCFDSLSARLAAAGILSAVGASIRI